MSETNFKNVLTAVVMVAFIGGCTYVMSNTTVPSTKIIDACIANHGYTWRNGECQKLP